MTKPLLTMAGLAAACLLNAQSNITSWQLNTTGDKGKYYALPGPTTVTLTDSSGVTRICTTSTSIYVRTKDLATYTMGPANNPNNPSGQNYIFKFPKSPSQQTGTKTTVPSGGAIGLAVNGVSLYGSRSADSYNTSTNTNTSTGNGVWHCDAWYNEGSTMDTSGNGHSDANKRYHYHANPKKLYDDPATAHSPIIGWAIDGYPIYGPYGYSTATNSGSAIKRLTSSYQLRSITTRTTLADGSTASSAGPAVSSSFPLGMYVEDYEYVSGLGDLDTLNGRYCVTPEYPSGTYAYFLSTDNAGTPSYPYILASYYYGVVAAADAGLNVGNATVPSSGVTCLTTNDAGAALNFDGSNDRVTVPTSTSLNFGTSDFTVESYFKSSVSQTNYAGVVVKANSASMVGFQLVLYNNKIAAEFGSPTTALGVADGLVGTTTITDGNWHHLAMVVTRSQNKIELFVDGVSEASVVNSSISSMNVNVTQPVLIGVERTSAVYVNGYIDEVRLWNVARTQCEINTYKSCEIATTTTGLVANYDFNQGTDAGSNSTETSLTDDSGNSNTGTLTNFSLTGSTSNWIAPGAITSGYTTAASLTPTVTASATSSVVCNGQSTTLSGGGASTYSWSDGITNATAFTPTVTHTYTVTGTNSYGCSSTAVKTITVNSLPTVTASASNSVICTGQSTTLSGGGANTYTWTGGVTNGISFSPTSTQSYTVTGKNTTTGCTNTAVQTVTVNTLPTITASASNSVICNGQSTTLSGGGASTYTWTGGVTNGTAFSPTTSQTYTVTGTDANGCTNKAVQSVTVNPLPSVTASATNSVVCIGQSTTLSGGGASIYTWTGGVTNGTAFSPTTTESYTVTGTNGTTGCTNTAVQTVTVNTLPSVTASATSSVICNGQSTILNGGGASTYTWTGGVTNGTAFSPTSTQSYTVTGTDANGCANTAVQTVTVNPLPSVTASASNSVICNGQSTTLSGGGASTYTWTSGVTNGTAFSPTSTQSYTVTGADGTTGCTNKAVLTVTVNTLPSVTASATSSVICIGQSTTLNGGGASTYTWTSGVTNGTAFSPTSTQSYTVTGTDAATNCTNTAVQTVTVNTLPVVTASTTNSVICNGQSIILNGGGASTYTWTSGVTNGTAFFPASSQSYTVTGTDVNGCTNTAVQSVTVNPLPTVSASITNSVICEGASTTLSGAGADTYSWSGGISDGVAFSPASSGSYTVTGTYTLTGCMNTAVASVTVNPAPVVTASNGTICAGNSFTITPGGADTYTISGGSNIVSPTSNASYTITGTSTEGCISNSTVITVSVQPSVTVSISGAATVCDGQAANLTANGATSYSWNTGDLTSSIAPTPTANASYTVTGTDGSCSGSATITVTVNPTPTVTIVSSSTMICAGQSVGLTASGANTYTWNTSATGATITDSPTMTTTYTVTGEDANGCISTATIQQIVNTCTSVNTSTTGEAVRLFPNPVKESATLELFEDAQVLIMNSVGQVISNEKRHAGSHQINLVTYPEGLYFITILGSQQAIKLIKE
jgi:hypothetical protein